MTVRGISLAALAAALTGCASHANLPSFGSVPEFVLTDQTGAKFDSSPELDGHVWVADFMFTNCPGPCPRMSSQMRQVQTALAPNGVKMVSLTIDPARDSPETLKIYSSRYAARPGVWFFLTGDVDTIRRLDRDVFKLGDIDGSLDHSTRFVLVDRKEQVRGYYLTEEPDAIKRVIADAKLLVKERA
ncbi:MAG TPA: SCO family protein [Bryobacteraceae bacterium]